MLVAIIPAGYRFDAPHANERPSRAKIVGERMAVYWRFVGGKETVEPTWTIAPITDLAELLESCRTVNERPSLPEPPEPPLPLALERREWAESRAEPVAGRPGE